MPETSTIIGQRTERQVETSDTHNKKNIQAASLEQGLLARVRMQKTKIYQSLSGLAAAEKDEYYGIRIIPEDLRSSEEQQRLRQLDEKVAAIAGKRGYHAATSDLHQSYRPPQEAGRVNKRI